MRVLSKLIAVLFLSIVMTAGASSADTVRSGEGIKIWFDTGGPVGGPYNTTVGKGAKQAAVDLGCELTLVYSDWNPEKMLENFKNGMAMDPDGMVIYGSPGDDAYEPLVKEAFDRGIIVTAIDTELPRLQPMFQSKGFGYIGPDGWKQGEDLAKEVLRRGDFKEGDRAFVWGLKRLKNRGRRARAIIKTLEDAGMVVDYLEISPEVDKDTALGTPIVTGYLSSHPDCKLMIMDHGALTSQVGNFLRASGVKPGEIFTAGFSLSPATASAIEEGYLTLVSEHQPYLLGYLSVLQIVQTKRYGFGGLVIDTGGGFVSSENVEVIAPLAAKGIR
ncbi:MULTISPECIES: sugar ABC transporter substrate-binding protein [Dethiosulfovibrio]|uniref:Substrate-binding domain-containing protein n=2 Tax=Dethiosulfovibrio TaxID=47054 RepID=A0ABS9EN89_9BACT|nr:MULTISPECIES: substrate-binding domain-containing protein [Dethiosulfovibrio]MCF4114153.1 substrate-binding domain-containing protein [Dethiosulfovibrio russensis]MCF4142657.1 substrate-binding domain-containing protein [Dethiosulfovibrio marinus]MCF4145176.1 substrate-binding domain-containing protein [Dethiosulfovibrio acidaminovorans]